MASVASFSGLASGVDWQTLLDQIMKVEARPIGLYQSQVASHQARQAAWESFREKVGALRAVAEGLADGTAFQAFVTSVTAVTASGQAPLTASAGAGAQPGTYQVKVLQLAAREKLGSDFFASASEALGLEGEFLVGGRAVRIEATYTLADVASAINRVNQGTTPSGVRASLVTPMAGKVQLVLTSEKTGAQGISLLDGHGGVLRSLGFLEGSTELKNPYSGGVKSDAFSGATTAVAILRGLELPPPAGLVTIGAGSSRPFMVELDLAAMSLEDIASAINAGAAAAGSAVSASVISEPGADGGPAYRLQIRGTTGFTDANGILELLGILQGGRNAVAQMLRSGAAFTDGDGQTVATGSTLLTNLWAGGAPQGVQEGDTLTLSGTRGDGTSFTKTFTVQADSRLDDLLTALNAPEDAFGGGSRPATASLVDGRIVVTDGAAGASFLALSIVAHNQGGGSLDFGDFTVAQAGRAREIVKGQDAVLEVDGTLVTRSSNTVSDAIPGVTLQLARTSEAAATVEVSRSLSTVTQTVKAFVEAYNALVRWVGEQFGGAGGEKGGVAPPLAGDALLRQMGNSLRWAMQTELSASLGGPFTRLGQLGIEPSRDGTYTFDEARFQGALKSDFEGVSRLFQSYRTTDRSTLSVLGTGPRTQAGIYDVVVTHPATRAQVTGSAFGGAYVDDTIPDRLVLRELDTGSEYAILLSDGMTLDQIVSALGTELATPRAHRLQSSVTLYADASGTLAGDSTPLGDLHDGEGRPLGVAENDVLSFAGTRADGSSFYRQFTVTSPATQTLGDLRAALAEELGVGEEVSWENGRLTVTARSTGRSSLAFSVSSDNAGGGALSFGVMETLVQGREAAQITASAEGGQLRLEHNGYGSSAGFTLSFVAGGSDGSASLGLGAGTYTGTDIAGSLGGITATGQGQVLAGAEGSPVEGLMVRYSGADTGMVGRVTLSRGVGAEVLRAADALLGTGAGTIQGVREGLDTTVVRLRQRIEDMQGRLERRRAELVRRFAAMEEALVKAQQQSQWIAAQFGVLQARTESRR